MSDILVTHAKRLGAQRACHSVRRRHGAQHTDSRRQQQQTSGRTHPRSMVLRCSLLDESVLWAAYGREGRSAGRASNGSSSPLPQAPASGCLALSRLDQEWHLLQEEEEGRGRCTFTTGKAMTHLRRWVGEAHRVRRSGQPAAER